MSWHKMGLSDIQGAYLTGVGILSMGIPFVTIVCLADKYGVNQTIAEIVGLAVGFILFIFVGHYMVKKFYAYNRKHPWTWYVDTKSGRVELEEYDNMTKEERLKLNMVNGDDTEKRTLDHIPIDKDKEQDI